MKIHKASPKGAKAQGRKLRPRGKTSDSTSSGSLKNIKELLSGKGRKKQGELKKNQEASDSCSSMASKTSSLNSSIRSLIGKRKLFHKGDKDAKRSKMDHSSATLPPLPQPQETPTSSRRHSNKGSKASSSGSLNHSVQHNTSGHDTSGPDLMQQDNNPWTQHLQQEGVHNSLVEAGKLFQYLIQPVSHDKFFSDIWQKKPLLVRRHKPHYNDGLFSLPELHRILTDKKLFFSKDIDVVSYSDESFQNHNPDGPARTALVWNFYQQGCSIRLLGAQKHCDQVHAPLSLLQEFFASVPAADVYLTPRDSQGFGPQLSSCDCFVLQLEGRNEWKVYEPPSPSHRLPRNASPSASCCGPQDPVLDVLLQSGDLLYLPRGFSHQASTQEDSHSLHLTICMGEKNTWADFLSTLIPKAVDMATEECVELRESLPTDYLNYMGIVHSEEDTPQRTEFKSRLIHLFSKLLEHAPIDSAADQMAKSFLSSSLPPCLTPYEKECSIDGACTGWKVGSKVPCSELTLKSQVKVIRKGCIRLVSEEQVCIYHNIDNSPSAACLPVQVSADEAEVVEVLLKTYPAYVAVNDLPMRDEADKLELVQLLYDRGMLLTKSPLHSKKSK